MRAVSLVACIALLALAGCGGSSKSGTISGTLTYVGGPPDPSRPHGETLHKQTGRVILRDSRGHTVAAAQQVRSGQRFRFQVTPNRYQLVLVTRGGQKVCPRAVRVREGKTTRSNLTCGIP